MKPVTVELSESLREIQQEWLGAERNVQDRIYAERFGEPFAREFASLPLHGGQGIQKPKYLISILGMSWQPVALMAAWLNPERMLVLGTPESLHTKGEDVRSRIARVSGVDSSRVLTQEVPSDGEVEIYQRIRRFLEETGAEPRTVAVDATGGKKSMCIAAGLAGFLRGCLLIYVDYAAYDEKKRIPLAGTEYPRLLQNPLEELGELDMTRIREAFNMGAFQEAARRAEDLAARLYAPREALALSSLAKGYGAWAAFRFGDALGELTRAGTSIDQFAGKGAWSWARGSLPEQLRAHVELLRSLARLEQRITENHRPATTEEGMPLVLNHVAAARRARSQGRRSEALMLLYSTVERYVDLRLGTEAGLDDEHPDYALLGDRLDLEVYHAVGAKMVGKMYTKRDLSGPLQFTSGLQLLAGLHLQRLDTERTLGLLTQLQKKRNKCEFEHGLLPPDLADADLSKWEGAVVELVKNAWRGETSFAEQLERYSFPML